MSPLKNAVSVPVTTFPEITFSEPVMNVPANFAFVDAEGNVPPVLLIGVHPDGSLASALSATDLITSLTIQPLEGLKYNEQYTLTLNNGMVDQNPLHLATFTLQFTTVKPQELGGSPSTDRFSATRGVAIGQRAYVGERLSSAIGGLGVIDISNPSSPIDEGTSKSFIGLPLDAAGQGSSPVARCPNHPPTAGFNSLSGGPLLAIAGGHPRVPTTL